MYVCMYYICRAIHNASWLLQPQVISSWIKACRSESSHTKADKHHTFTRVRTLRTWTRSRARRHQLSPHSSSETSVGHLRDTGGQ